MTHGRFGGKQRAGKDSCAGTFFVGGKEVLLLPLLVDSTSRVARVQGRVDRSLFVWMDGLMFDATSPLFLARVGVPRPACVLTEAILGVGPLYF